MPRLKVCGIRDAAFAAEAARRGVDYLGLIFAEGSPRRVSVEEAALIVRAARGPRHVGVFVAHPASEIAEIAARVGFGIVQLHGEYGPADVVALKSKGFEVWRLDTGDGREAGEDAILLDGGSGRRRGGTGTLADWSRVALHKRAGRRVVLAGGISAGNVSAAIATGADVIDVNSSIEVSSGVKSVRMLDMLLAAARH